MANELYHTLEVPVEAAPEEIRRAVHDGLLANDVISFQTARWRRNFLRSAEDHVGAECNYGGSVAIYGGRRSLVTHHPISVDVHEFEELALSEAVLAEERAIEERRKECWWLVLRDGTVVYAGRYPDDADTVIEDALRER